MIIPIVLFWVFIPLSTVTEPAFSHLSAHINTFELEIFMPAVADKEKLTRSWTYLIIYFQGRLFLKSYTLWREASQPWSHLTCLPRLSSPLPGQCLWVVHYVIVVLLGGGLSQVRPGSCTKCTDHHCCYVWLMEISGRCKIGIFRQDYFTFLYMTVVMVCFILELALYLCTAPLLLSIFLYCL